MNQKLLHIIFSSSVVLMVNNIYAVQFERTHIRGTTEQFDSGIPPAIDIGMNMEDIFENWIGYWSIFV